MWADLARELIAGECLEILSTGTDPDPQVSLKVVRYKTAKYTVEQPLLIGALLAGGTARLRAGLSAYGLPLGEAFQLRDDLLGLFGEPGRTGKASLDDIRGRRPTALIRHLIGDTCADWLEVPHTAWDSVVKAVPRLLGVLETIEDRSPLGAWALDRLGHLATVLELSSLTRGRVMHYAIPEPLKKDFGVSGPVPRNHRWTPPAPSVAS
ncbi:polyprenyl synthetase family protein [Streptomyces sp. NPDC004596]